MIPMTSILLVLFLLLGPIRYSRSSSAALRVFGPRPLIRDVFTREQELSREEKEFHMGGVGVVSPNSKELNLNSAASVMPHAHAHAASQF